MEAKFILKKGGEECSQEPSKIPGGNNQEIA